MKKILIPIFALAILSACNPAKQASTGYNNDDVYYSSASKPAPAPVINNSSPAPVSNPDNYSSGNNSNSTQGDSRFDYNNPNNNSNASSGTTTRSSGGNTYVNSNYYNNDDYYDYAYSSRLRRFYNPSGLGYYDPFYTNSYWYDYNPSSWGISIYSTYGWWAPSYYYSYNPFCGSHWGISFGFGYPGWYRPYYYPMYNPYAWGGYNNGYMNGYQNGYWDAYYNNLYSNNYTPYYYNSYDNNSHYYGYHHKVAGNSGAGTANYIGGRNSTMQQGHSLANVYASNVSPADAVHAPVTLPVRGSTMVKGNNILPSKSNNDIYSGRDNTDNGAVKNVTTPGRPMNPDINNNGTESVKPNTDPRDYSSYPPKINNTDGNVNPAPRDNNYNGNPRPNYSNPGSNDVKDNSSGPRPSYTNPRSNDVKENQNMESAPKQNKKSKWGLIFNRDNSSGNEYSEPKKGNPNEYSQPKYEAPKQQRQEPARNNSQPPPRQENRSNSSERGSRTGR